MLYIQQQQHKFFFSDIIGAGAKVIFNLQQFEIFVDFFQVETRIFLSLVITGN